MILKEKVKIFVVQNTLVVIFFAGEKLRLRAGEKEMVFTVDNDPK